MGVVTITFGHGKAKNSGGETNGREGWGFPANAKKAHYFVGGTALCGKWMYFGEYEAEGNVPSKDDCKACRRKLEKQKEAE